MLRRFVSAVLLVGLVFVRFAAADDHAHLFENGSGEPCAACLVGSGPADVSDAVAVVDAPRACSSDVRFVPVEAPRLSRTGWLPPACGPPATFPTAST